MYSTAEQVSSFGPLHCVTHLTFIWLSSFFHVVLDWLIKNRQEEACILHCDAHWGFDPKGLKQKKEQNKRRNYDCKYQNHW